MEVQRKQWGYMMIYHDIQLLYSKRMGSIRFDWVESGLIEIGQVKYVKCTQDFGNIMGIQYVVGYFMETKSTVGS